MFASLIPLRKLPATLPQSFTYNVPQDLEGRLCIGQLVEAPFQRGVTQAIVWSMGGKAPKGIFHIKMIASLIKEQPLLTQAQHKLIQWMSTQYAVHPSMLVKRIMPVLPKKASPDHYIPSCPVPRQQKKAVYYFEQTAGALLTPSLKKHIRKAKQNKQQILLLIPDYFALVAVADNLKRQRISFTVLHSDLTAAQYRECYFSAAQTKNTVILGTRKALFLPFTNLYACVQLFANDANYKQWDQKPRYHTHDVARMLCTLHGAMYLQQDVYPSTLHIPSITAKKLFLKKREVSAWQKPRILSKEYQSKDPTHPSLLESMKDALEQSKQVLLFEQHSSHDAYMLCRECGWTPVCPHCNKILYNTALKVLSCPLCTYRQDPPATCQSCASDTLSERKTRSANYTTALKRIVPLTRIVHIQSTHTVSAVEKLYARWKNHEIDILIGTPSLAHGWLLPQVAFSCILSLESLLSHPGFQEQERMFHFIIRLLSSKIPLTIIAQNSENEFLSYLAEKKHRAYFTKELQERTLLAFPPYVQLLSFTTRASAEQRVTERLDALEKKLKDMKAVLYRTPIPYPKKRGSFYGKITVKYPCSAFFKLPDMVYGEVWTVDPSPEDIL